MAEVIVVMRGHAPFGTLAPLLDVVRTRVERDVGPADLVLGVVIARNRTAKVDISREEVVASVVQRRQLKRSSKIEDYSRHVRQASARTSHVLQRTAEEIIDLLDRICIRRRQSEGVVLIVIADPARDPGQVLRRLITVVPSENNRSG